MASLNAQGIFRPEAHMELLPYTEDDLALTEAIECDPDMMRELGGPIARSEIPRIHQRRLDTTAKGDWWLKIVPDPPGPPAGTIGIWETSWNGSTIHEMGWMVLPAFQGRGIASAATEIILARARADPRFRRLHAFPGVTNEPSNALCRRFGFTKLEECDGEYAGRPLRCNHWELRLTDPRIAT
jgi:RimJ/RimL family protein N-acetyltransferase